MPLARSRPRAATAPLLLVVSFALGAATEVDLAAGAARAPLGGTAAVAHEELELVLDGTAQAPLLAGTTTRVELLLAPGGVPVPGWRAQLDEGEPAAPSESPGLPTRAEALRCSLVLVAAGRTQRLAEADEDAAVESACAGAMAQRRPTVTDVQTVDPLQGPESPRARAQRARALYDASRSGAPQLRPRVRALEAAVVPGTGTASAVAVRLGSPRGARPPAQELVRVAYPGGSVTGRTDAEGRALLPVPDVALDEPLPLRVTWRGTAPAGTFVGPFLPPPGAVLDEQDEEPLLSGWLREDLPYSLSTTVLREAR